jgi:hypothetical protein
MTMDDQHWTLECVIDDLVRLNRDTEQYFLTIGDHLSGFIDTVGMISSDLTTLVSQVSKKLGGKTSQAFTAALDRSKAMQARVEGSGSILGSLGQEAGRVKHILAGFQQNASTFRTLGILTRIEGARLGDASADFSGLAAMAGDVRIRVEKALAGAALLIPAIEGAIQSVAALEKAQANDLPLVIARVLASLAKFSDIQKKAHKVAARMVAQYDAIAQAFTKLIVSMQFHDITRQQIEHVVEVLQNLCLQAGAPHEVADNGLPMASIAALQSSQLADAADKFARSVASIALSLDEIAIHTTKMAAESTLLFDLSEGNQSSIFLEMEQGCNAILASLAGCVKAENATRDISDRLSQTTGGMRAPVEEIRAITIQVQRVGMNARIRAASAGTVGDALGALSRSIQELAVETQQCAESLLGALGSMKDSISRLSQREDYVVGGATGDQDCYVEGMRLAAAELHSNERGFAQIAQIVARGDRLREDLNESRNNFSVGAVFAQAISHARGMLAEIAGPTHLLEHEGLEASLVDFAKHYTVQAERDVHETLTRRITKPTQIAIPAKQEQKPPEGSTELGGDVEFF